MAQLIPCRDRQIISMIIELEKKVTAETTVKKIIPQRNTFFSPMISASLPKGTRNTLNTRRKELTTQLRRTASAWNSWPIKGTATFIPEVINEVKKIDIEVAISVGW